MNLIKEYSEFLPKEELVKQYLKIIDSQYRVISDKSTGYKITLIDDRLYYLSGPFGNKTRLANRIYFDMNYEESFHEPSLRRAIKDWIDNNSN